MLGLSSITITRKVAGAQTFNDYGVPITKATSAIATTASVQSPSSQILEQLAEGERTKDPKIIVSETELKVDDLITYSGNTYKLLMLNQNDYTDMASTSHYKGLMIRSKE